MIDARKLTRWYDFQAGFYSRWRDDPDSAILGLVHDALPCGAAPRPVLDAGCGTGWCALGLSVRDVERRVVGLDASSGMLRVARRNAERQGLPGIGWVRGSVAAIPARDRTFGGAVAAGLFANLDDHAGALAELHRVLAPRAPLIVVEFDRRALRGARRAVFASMILGYRVVSRLLPRFRFADDWSVERSTVALSSFRKTAARAGFDEDADRPVEFLEAHWVLALRRRDG